MNKTDYIVQLTNVKKSYMLGKVEVQALKGITLEIPRKKFNVIIGQSGSGKSTLLNIIGCIDKPSSGGLNVCGQDTALLNDNELSDFRAKNIGFIFQSYNLIPVLSVFENVEYPLLLNKIKKKERKEKVMEALENVKLADHWKKIPNELSGGQRQRVAIARALVKQPQLALADEPTANLDHKTGGEIIKLMYEMQEKKGITFIFSTHDKNLIYNAEDIFMIIDGELL
ncbi:MAG TPA: ABC transporter ATP-binding protein [bacterium]|nr:ABC transporter ATP-binding protein [bacterium]